MSYERTQEDKEQSLDEYNIHAENTLSPQTTGNRSRLFYSPFQVAEFS